MDKRTANKKIQTRSENDEKIIEGYFAVFNTETELYNGYYEKINRNAFKNLNKDIKALINHNDSAVLARTTNGTLELKTDDVGLFGKIKINDKDTEAMNLYERVKRGDINQCSFGFYINEERTNWDNDKLHVELLDLDLLEVSVVTFPAYEATRINARSKVKNAKIRKIKEKINDVKNIIKQ